VVVGCPSRAVPSTEESTSLRRPRLAPSDDESVLGTGDEAGDSGSTPAAAGAATWRRPAAVSSGGEGDDDVDVTAAAPGLGPVMQSEPETGGDGGMNQESASTAWTVGLSTNPHVKILLISVCTSPYVCTHSLNGVSTKGHNTATV